MTRIHPTAIVDPKAGLAEDVVVEPYAIIGPDVTVGPRSVIGAHTVLSGRTTIGADNRISPFCSLGGPPQDKKYANEATELVIGDRNVIREYCYFNTGTIQDAGLTKIGDDNWIMGYVHVAHDCMIGNHTILANSTQLAGHVHLGDWVFLGGLTGVHQFVKVGAHAMTAAHSYLSQDLPPYVTCQGSPGAPRGINSEGLKRRGFSAESIAAIKQAYRILYRSQLSLEAATEQIRELANGPQAEALTPFVAFIAASTRGIVR